MGRRQVVVSSMTMTAVVLLAMIFAGALFPGMPYPALGHNNTLGWTNTVNRADLIDVYKLTLDDSGTRYRFDGAWRAGQQPRIEDYLFNKMKLSVYDMVKAVDRGMHIADLRLIEKSGGKSGLYRAE